MAEPKEPCKYHDYNSDGCPYEVDSDGYCIFHLPKQESPEDEKQRLINSKFGVEFRKLFYNVLEDQKKKKFNFKGFQFPGNFSFSGLTFIKAVILDNSVFSGRVDFNHTKFEDKLDFSYAKLKQDSNFQYARFDGWATFAKTEFYGICNFQNAHLEKVQFHNTSFKDKAHFPECVFNSYVSFQDTVFEEESNYRYAKFEGHTDFINTTFLKDVYFTRANFNGKTVFFATTFGNQNNQNKVKAEFEETNFNSNIFFSNPTFYCVASFVGSICKQSIKFKGMQNNYVFRKPLNFRLFNIGTNAIVLFEHVDLSEASFLETNMSTINFRDVRWYSPPKTWPLRKNALWDEFKPLHSNNQLESFPLRDTESKYYKLAENYSQLVLSFDNKRDFESAEDFHIGEMEMRRKMKGEGEPSPRKSRRKKLLNSYNLYRILSNYGTSYWQAAGLIALMVFVIFPVLFLFFGFKQAGTVENDGSSVIEYELLPDSSHQPVSLFRFCSDYSKSLSFSLSILSFQRSHFYEPSGIISQILSSGATLVFYAQLSLVLLAIRRRFKR